MKQVQQLMSRWVKGFVTTASMFVFSVSLASGNDITVAAPNTSTPYSYSDPNSTAPSYDTVGRPVDEETNSLMLNNQALGLENIPVTVSTGYSANYGYEMNASFSHMMGFYDAISLLGAYAPQENRVDITWAHAWTEKQRTKVSVERLEEAMDFDYDSGSVTEWVPQYSYGAGYQYLFNKNWLKNVELTGYYAKAQSQDLDTIRFTGTDGNLYDNYRHIAGATSKGSEAMLNVSPWKTGLVGLGLNYDSVNYDTKYDDTDAEDASGLGFTLTLEQLLSKHVKLDLEGSQREVYDDYVAGVSFLTPSNLELGVNGERTLGENGSASDSRFNLNLAYFFDDKNRYENGYNLVDPSENDLSVWASKSVAYMDEVLAAADQQTIQVDTPPENNNPMLQSDDTTPVISLTVGEINHVDVSDYIASANLTDAQKQATPVIKGGPSNVEFTYDNSTQSLVTKAAVPESAASQESAPLVLIFPTDTANEKTFSKGTLRDALTDRLTFKVTVGSSAPTLNANFDSTQDPILEHAQTWVFEYENPTNPTDPLAMFINTNSTKSSLKMSSGYPSKGTSDPNNCYTFAPNSEGDTTETLTITGKASDVCPGNATITVKTTNGSLASPIQTITFTALPAGTPSISGDAITSPTILEGQTYSPGHTFTTTEVSPGKNETFNTASSETYVKVFDTGTTGTTCTDVTSGANWGLGFTNGDTQAILQSTGPVPASLTGHKLKIYLHITNGSSDTAHNSADNGTTSGCAGTPFTSTVEGEPYIPANIPLGSMTVDTSYTYDFMTSGGSAYNVSAGSSPITSMAGSTITVKNSSGTEVSSTGLGLSLAQQGSDVVLSGIVNPGFAGDTVYVTLNLTNAYGTSTNSAAPAFSLSIAANAVNVPTIASAQTLTATQAGSAYNYSYTTPPMTAGNGESFNTTSTTATVVDAGNGDATVAGFSLVFNSPEDTAVTGLTAPESTVATLKGPLHVTYTAVNADGQTASSLAGQYDTIGTDMINLTDGTVLNQATVGTAYTDSLVAHSALSLGSTGLSPSDTGTSTVTMSIDGTSVSAVELGLTPAVSATNVTVTGTPNTGYAGKTVTFNLNLQTPDTLLTQAGTATLTIAANSGTEYQPNVNGGLALTNGVQYTDYTTYTFATTDVYAGEAGSNETFSTDATKTYAVVTDPNGTAYSTATAGSPFALAFSNGNTQITLNGVTGQALQVQGQWKVVLHVANVDGNAAFNAVPDTFNVTQNVTPEYQPNVTGGLALTDAPQYTDYTTYTFSTTDVYAGEAGSNETFDPATTSVTVTDPNGVDQSAQFALAYNTDKTQITLNGVAGQALQTQGQWKVVLHVQNKDGGTADNVANPDTFNVTQNVTPEYQPNVTGGLALTDAPQYADYTTYTFSTTDVYAGVAGSNETFDPATTSVTVTDPNGIDQSAQFALAYNTDKTQITLNGVAGQALQTQGQWKVVLHVQNKDGGTADNVANPDTFNVTQNPAYAPQPGDTGHALNNAVVNAANSVTYSYTSYASTPMKPGPDGSNETFNTTTTKALVYYTTDTAKANPLPGFSLEFNAGNTAITGLTASSSTIAALTGPVNVYYQAVNNDDPNYPVTSTVADTIATDMITIADNTTLATQATVASSYNYSFVTKNQLTLGSTGLSPSTGGSSTVTMTYNGAAVTPAEVGLTPAVTATDITVTGTPNAGYAGTIMLNFNLHTPDGLLIKTPAASLVINGTTPVVISGPMPNVLMHATYSYTFANSGTTGPVVSAGEGEYFDENPTSGTKATVILNKGKAGEQDVSNLFHLVYSNSASQSTGNSATNNGHNVVTLVSDDVASEAGDLTVDFHVVNVDSGTVAATAGTIMVGSVTGYLYCPSSQNASGRPQTTTSNLTDAPSGGDVLTSVTFTKQSSVNTGTIQLSAASLSNGKLTCQYGYQGDDLSGPQFVTVATVPSSATGYTSDWTGNQCSLSSNISAATANASCQVTYAYEG